MKDDLPITPPPRPVDPFTALDGARLFALIDSLGKRIESSLAEQSNRIAGLSRVQLEISERLAQIEKETSDNRVKRLEIEVEEAEQEKRVAEERLRIAEARVQKKQTIKDEGIDTAEKIKLEATRTYMDIEQARKQKNAERWDNIKWGLLQWSLIFVGGAIGTGVIGLIVFLIRLYLNRGSP